jgi:hypothetical protein
MHENENVRRQPLGRRFVAFLRFCILAFRDRSASRQNSERPSISDGIGTPKYFSTVGAMSMIRASLPAASARLEMSVPGVDL